MCINLKVAYTGLKALLQSWAGVHVLATTVFSTPYKI